MHACVWARLSVYNMMLLTSRTRLCSWDCWRRRPGTAVRCSADRPPRTPPFPGISRSACAPTKNGSRERDEASHNGCRIITVLDGDRPTVARIFFASLSAGFDYLEGKMAYEFQTSLVDGARDASVLPAGDVWIFWQDVSRCLFTIEYIIRIVYTCINAISLLFFQD